MLNMTRQSLNADPLGPPKAAAGQSLPWAFGPRMLQGRGALAQIGGGYP